ncbi:hypothetical protein FRC02_011194 [Tulasnella sp. 418]|nr:hypothetical protein FRC02_011194 [Tulasnella sp. 418]
MPYDWTIDNVLENPNLLRLADGRINKSRESMFSPSSVNFSSSHQIIHFYWSIHARRLSLSTSMRLRTSSGWSLSATFERDNPSSTSTPSLKLSASFQRAEQHISAKTDREQVSPIFLSLLIEDLRC